MNVILRIRYLDEKRFPVFSKKYRKRDGEYILPFWDHSSAFNLHETVEKMLTEWESLFLEIENAGAKLELRISLTQEELRNFSCLEFLFTPELMEIFERLNMVVKIKIKEE
ncbi:MAG: hypothetical protein Q4C70_12180 [Planctomycetia bacterium]|nr:hypothetical protein [Planctomycetia bacterium]